VTSITKPRRGSLARRHDARDDDGDGDGGAVADWAEVTLPRREKS